MLVRADAAGCTHEFLDCVVSQRLSYSVGFTLPDDFADVLPRIPKQAWTPAIDAGGGVREGAWVADVTGLLNPAVMAKWPKGIRVIVQGTPHPGAQLRLTDPDGLRVTAFATNTKPGRRRGQLADLELRHRRRARAEDQIRCAKDTGLRNLPLHDLDQNRIWCAIIALACELTAWMQLLAFTGHSDTTTGDTTTGDTTTGGDTAGHEARRWEPKRLRLRLFSTAARIARTGRRIIVHIASDGAWTDLLLHGLTRLQALATPG